MKLILDVENTVTKRDDKMHLDPFGKRQPINYGRMSYRRWQEVSVSL